MKECFVADALLWLVYVPLMLPHATHAATNPCIARLR